MDLVFDFAITEDNLKQSSQRLFDIFAESKGQLTLWGWNRPEQERALEIIRDEHYVIGFIYTCRLLKIYEGFHISRGSYGFKHVVEDFCRPDPNYLMDPCLHHIRRINVEVRRPCSHICNGICIASLIECGRTSWDYYDPRDLGK